MVATTRPDVTELQNFYRTRLGRLARLLLLRRLRRLLPLNVQYAAGLGYALPIFSGIQLMPGGQGAIAWPRRPANRVAMVDELALPLADGALDQLVLLHALEHSTDPDQLLAECWRVLAGNGRLLLVVPHRAGFWARSERTPFGAGRPFSRGQLRRLLADSGFTCEQEAGALFGPLLLSEALGWARTRRVQDGLALLWPAGAGLLVLLARKELVQPVIRRRPADFLAGLQPARLRPALGQAGHYQVGDKP